MASDRAQARKRLLPFYEDLYRAYPRHQDFGGGFQALLDLVESGHTDLQLLEEKARSFARNVDPNELEYVPFLKSWLRDRRFEDEDLFTDRVVAQREWFIGCYRRGDAAAVAQKYGFLYNHPPMPDDVQDRDAWHENQRKLWIAQVARHILHGGPLPE